MCGAISSSQTHNAISNRSGWYEKKSSGLYILLACYSSRGVAFRSFKFYGTELRAPGESLRWLQRFSTGFRSAESKGHSTWSTSMSNSHSKRMWSKMNWSITSHQDRIRPVMFMKRYNDWINGVIQIEWTCPWTISICFNFLLGFLSAFFCLSV